MPHHPMPGRFRRAKTHGTACAACTAPLADPARTIARMAASVAAAVGLAACATPTADLPPPGGKTLTPALGLESSGTGPTLPAAGVTPAAPPAPPATEIPSLDTYVPWAIDCLDVFDAQAAVLDAGMADLDQNPGQINDMHFKIGLGVAAGLINAKAVEIATRTAVPAAAAETHAELQEVADAVLEAAALYSDALAGSDEARLRDAHAAMRAALAGVPALRASEALRAAGAPADG